MNAATALALMYTLDEAPAGTEKGDEATSGGLGGWTYDLEQAVAWNRKALAKGLPSAYSGLADVLFQRYLKYCMDKEEEAEAGREEDEETAAPDAPLPPGMVAELHEAVALARRAVDLGVHEGHTALGQIYLLGAPPVLEVDLEAAARELHLAVGYDMPSAEYLLGMVYEAQNNMTESRRWLRRAADNGHLEAIGALQRREQ